MNVLCWCPFVHLIHTPFQNLPYSHEETPTQVFSREFIDFLRTPLLTEYLRWQNISNGLLAFAHITTKNQQSCYHLLCSHFCENLD